MLSIQALSVLAIAGSAAALPQWPNWAGNYFGGSDHHNAGQGGVATDVQVVTAYTTVTAAGNWGGNGGNWGGQGQQATPTAASMAAWTPAPQAAAASSAPQAASSGNTEGGPAYMAIVNEWRSKMGMSNLVWDQTLQNNDQKTVNDDKGTMTHELNPGSFAQVLAPGGPDDFEKVFVGGWLCEIPTLPGLDGICNTMSQGWAYDGQTGHADILTSKAYSKIGCANAYNLWGCDLA